MSPRPGGEAAKFGARFEGRWTASHLLDVLMGRADAVTVEAVDPDSDSVEFIVLASGREEGHQVKRQWKDRMNWSIQLLDEQGILGDAASHVARGRDFHFVSTLSAHPLAELAELARRANDFASFSALISGTKTLRNGFDVLSKLWSTPQQAYETLRHVEAWKPDERQLQKANVSLAQWLFEGEPEPAIAVLAEIANDTLGVALTSDRLWRELEARKVTRNPLYDDTTLASLVDEQTRRLLRTTQAGLLQPPIPREETAAAAEALASGRRLVVVVGEAGSGKSAVVGVTVEQFADEGNAVLAFRLDQFMDVRSSRQLGAALDLPVSPVVALAAAAAGRPALLVIDQLDAVSLASGRSTEVFEVVEDMLLEADRLPNIQVLLACRQYDIDNDRRLGALVDPQKPGAPEVIRVERLNREQVERAVSEMGLDPAALTDRQFELLQLPLNLVLLREVAGEEDAFDFGTTRDLLERFWTTKRRAVAARRADARFDEVIGRLVDSMSASQSLAAPEAVLHPGSLEVDAEVLVSEHVIVRDGRQYSFFHETLFDYAFAREWVARNESVLEFLLGGEQELFRRAQVRQVLLHLRDAEPGRFVQEVRAVLIDGRVRFHVKESIIGVLRALPDPSEEELRLVLELLEGSAPWRPRLELVLRTVPWFDRLETSGALAEWLTTGDADVEGRAVTIIGAAGDDRAAAVAALLAPHRRHPRFVEWLLWIGRFVALDKDRGLFELFLGAVRDGLLDEHEHMLFLSAHSLGDQQPEWAVELLEAWLAGRPGALAHENGRVADMRSSDYGLLELVQKAAEGAPEQFVSALLPYMQDVMRIAGHGDQKPQSDWHFASRMWGQHLSEADDMLMNAMTSSLKRLAVDDPARLRELVEPLIDDPHEAAQDLLYEGVAAAGAVHAEWAGELVQRGGPALRSGYSDEHYWTTRELLLATSAHMTDETFAAVERTLVSFEPDWERSHPPSRGHAAFTLLSALPEERLSSEGRRKLNELRRKFGRDQPAPPRGIVAGFVGPPIPAARAEHMTDDQWIGAMRKHAADEGDWQTFELRGGAVELSHVLKEATMKEPERFARFGVQLDQTYNKHYLEAILLGLGDTTEDVDPELVYQVMRHAAGSRDHDRWLGWPLKRLYRASVPEDIIRILVARARGVADLDAKSESPAPDEPFDMGDAFSSGLNSERGGNAHTLAALVAFDVGGERAAIVEPHLLALANDPSPAVRACVAEVVHQMLRWRRDAAVQAFEILARDRDPALVKTPQFEGLAAAVILTDVEVALPMIEDVLASEDEAVRERGARLAAFAATDGGRDDLLEGLVRSNDPALRRGVAHVLAARVRWVDKLAVREALVSLFDDDDQAVRKAAATFAGNLRGEDLGPHKQLLESFISSPASEDPTQLLLTLENAPVPDHELTLRIAQRVITAYGSDLGDIQTSAAGDVRHVADLVLRSYTLAEDPQMRSQLLDVIDRLLELGAYGITEAIDEAGR